MEAFTRETCRSKNIVNYLDLLSSAKRALKQNIMNLRGLKMFSKFYLNLRFLIKSSMDIK